MFIGEIKIAHLQSIDTRCNILRFSYWENLKRMFNRTHSKKLFDPELMYKKRKLSYSETDNDLTKQHVADSSKTALREPERRVSHTNESINLNYKFK